jgi:hypothetical protein
VLVLRDYRSHHRLRQELERPPQQQAWHVHSHMSGRSSASQVWRGAGWWRQVPRWGQQEAGWGCLWWCWWAHLRAHWKAHWWAHWRWSEQVAWEGTTGAKTAAVTPIST